MIIYLKHTEENPFMRCGWRIVFLAFLFSLLLPGFGLNDMTRVNGQWKSMPNPSPNRRKPPPINNPADVTKISFDREEIFIWRPYFSRETGAELCAQDSTVKVSTTAVDPDNDVLIYDYSVNGGRIVGQGANVFWDFSGINKPGTYTLTAGVDDGCGVCGKVMTKTVEVKECGVPLTPEGFCFCPAFSIRTSPELRVKAGEATVFSVETNDPPGGKPLEYNWTISGETDGAIITEGQGTTSIKVQTTEAMAGKLLTVTIELSSRGLCPTCNKVRSETVRVIAKRENN